MASHLPYLVPGEAYSPHRWNALGTYNAEVSRGIVHTPEWDDRMAEDQRLFDAEVVAGYEARGGRRVEGGWSIPPPPASRWARLKARRHA